MPAERRLSVQDGGRAREVMLVGTVTVGRSPDCEISSPDPRLSRAHAAFDLVGDEVVVRDLGSRNGTLVNGLRITEHRLADADRVEVGPFVVQLVAAPAPAKLAPAARPAVDDDVATVMLPRRAPAPVEASATPPVQPPEPPPARPTPPVTVAPPPVVATTPIASTDAGTAAAPAPAKARRPARELTFANTTLLWIVPLVLISFLAGLIPDALRPDERPPLLRAHYEAVGLTAIDLVSASHEPAVPIDRVTTALRRQPGVTAARVIGADGRVLAPMDQAGTQVPPPAAPGAGVTIAAADNGGVSITAPAQTGDGRPVVVALTIDPERIAPSPPGSPLGTVLLLLSLAAAWLVARRLTNFTDARLSRLGEEVELMTTRQVSVGHDPFSLTGSRRILDAVTFALSDAGRLAGGGPLSAPRDSEREFAPASATVLVDAGFRIVRLDRGCEVLLGIDRDGGIGRHLLEALPDQTVSDEVMRLLTVATPERSVSGEVATSDAAARLAIVVTRGGAAAPTSIRFQRM